MLVEGEIWEAWSNLDPIIEEVNFDPTKAFLISFHSHCSTRRGKINDDCYRRKKELAFEPRPLAYIHLILKSRHLFLVRRHLCRCRHTAAVQSTKKGQLWLISFFRQLLTTKVTTAQWFCGSIMQEANMSLNDWTNHISRDGGLAYNVTWRLSTCFQYLTHTHAAGQEHQDIT
jgi:hypothetical protein